MPSCRKVVASALLVALVGCATVAITGRSQFNIVPEADLIRYANTSYAKFIGDAEAKNSVLRASESGAAADTLKSVAQVSNRIIDAAGLRGQYKWQVTVIRSPEANAFVMPNGRIVVYTGILPITRDDAGLAAVIGHEVAHVVAHHAAERLSQSLVAQAAIDVAGAASDPGNASLVAAALGIGAQYGVLLPFSRQHESEADRIGQIFMAKAGYDPAEAIALWVRMAASAEKSGKSAIEFASTHPSSETRQAQLRQWLPEAQLYYRDRNRALPVVAGESRR